MTAKILDTTSFGARRGRVVAGLSRTLHAVVDSLKESAGEEADQAFIGRSLAALARQIEGQKDAETLSRLVLCELSPLVSAHCGAFFLMDTEEGAPVLRLVASYALRERKQAQNRWKPGEGLVGQCALEKKPIVLTAVPEGYLCIGSGLGEAAPREIVVQPVVFRGEVKAVLELASLSRFSPTHHALLERFAERLGAALDGLGPSTKPAEDPARPPQEGKADEGELGREREARKQAEASNRVKDEFLALVSHELRTPLTAILGWARLLQSATPGAIDQPRALSAIERNAAALARLVGDLSDVSRVVTGKLSLEVRPLDLAGIVTSAVDAIRPDAEEKNLSLDVELDPRLGPLEGDGGRLSQVCTNLLANAVKFTPRNGRITVRLTELGSEVELKVSDSGQGITAALLPNIFERLRRADAPGPRGQGGLGLGLALVRSIVELHGGTVRAASPGTSKGAVFTVTLPRRPGTLACADLAPEGGAEVTLSGVRVLVVDDEQDARDLIATLLEMRGAEVSVAASTRDALEAIGKTKPHVILSDLAMPNEDGYELIRRVRALDPDRGGAIPAAALTAYSEPEVGQRVRAAGFHEHVAKPVDPQRLAALVADLARRPFTLGGAR